MRNWTSREGLHFNYQTALREVTEINHTAQGAKTGIRDVTEIKITTQGVTAQGAKEQ